MIDPIKGWQLNPFSLDLYSILTDLAFKYASDGKKEFIFLQ